MRDVCLFRVVVISLVVRQKPRNQVSKILIKQLSKAMNNFFYKKKLCIKFN